MADNCPYCGAEPVPYSRSDIRHETWICGTSKSLNWPIQHSYCRIRELEQRNAKLEAVAKAASFVLKYKAIGDHHKLAIALDALDWEDGDDK